MTDRDRIRGLRGAWAPALVLAIGPGAVEAGAQAIGPGDRVVLVSTEDALKVERRVVATGEVHRVFTVGRVDGPWLWLEAEDVAGWARIDRVLPFDRALELATARIEAGGAEAGDYNARGLLWADRGRPDLAEDDFAEAIRREPEWHLPRLNRGVVRRAAGGLDEALSDLARAAELAPLDPLPYFNRGLARLDRGEPRRAFEDFGLALRVDPNHAGTRFNRAATALALGIDGASADAEAFLVLVGWYEARSPYAAILAALEHRREGRPEQAAGLLDAAAKEIAPASWPAPILAYLRGERDLPALLEAADTPDQQAEARAYAGLALRIGGRPEEADPLLDWVVERGDPGLVPHLIARSALDPPAAPDPGSASGAGGPGPGD